MNPYDGRVVSNFIVQALRGEDMTVYGDGSQTRSFCYIDDLIAGLELLMESPDEITGPCNLGNPEESRWSFSLQNYPFRLSSWSPSFLVQFICCASRLALYPSMVGEI